MALNNLCFAPALGVAKINIHCVVNEVIHINENLNNICMIARDHESKFLWGIMGPLKGMEGVQSQIWAVHQVTKIVVKRDIHHMHIETDNIVAFDILAEHDEEILENEGVTVAVQQINVLHVELNKVLKMGRNHAVAESLLSFQPG